MRNWLVHFHYNLVKKSSIFITKNKIDLFFFVGYFRAAWFPVGTQRLNNVETTEIEVEIDFNVVSTLCRRWIDVVCPLGWFYALILIYNIPKIMLFPMVFLDFANSPKLGRCINSTYTKMNGISESRSPHLRARSWLRGLY